MSTYKVDSSNGSPGNNGMVRLRRQVKPANDDNNTKKQVNIYILEMSTGSCTILINFKGVELLLNLFCQTSNISVKINARNKYVCIQVS